MTPRPSPSRRWLACCCLTVAWAMANWGGMVLHAVLAGWWFVAWWSVCAALALFSVLLALSEVIAAWRLLRANQRRCETEQRRELDQQGKPKETDRAHPQ